MSGFKQKIRVYIEDTDAGGIVYYVNYLKFMERARTEFIRHLGYDKPAVMEDGLLFVVHSVAVNYRRPAHLDDELIVSARPLSVGRANVVFEQKILRGEELLSSGEIKVACVDGDSMKPKPIPAAMYEALRASIELDK